jgi:3-phenylpropionate/trans-cinnamate dioxygenase ferredoxin reductase subunit
VDDGVVVDEYCHASVDDVFAAGDIARHYHPTLGRHVRVEHWENAIRQSTIAAHSMLGRRVAYDPVHWFWSDQYDVNLQYAGFRDQSHTLVVRGSLAHRAFVGLFLNDEGRVTAVVGVNRGKDVRRAMRLIEARTVVEPRLLADEHVDFRSLVHVDAANTSR